MPGERPRSGAAAALVAVALLAGGCTSLPGPRPAPGPEAGSGAGAGAARRPPPGRRGPESYVVHGRRYHVLASARGYVERGIASWYGGKFHGRRTASGEVYDMRAMTAAHRTLPLPTWVEVTNLENGARVVVKVNDRGPFHRNRLIDLSRAAAERLGIVRAGTGYVEVRALTSPEPAPDARPATRAARAQPVRLYLQAGAFAVAENAERFSRRLNRTVRSPVEVVRVRRRDGSALYRVRLGPLAGVEQADRLTSVLASRGFETPHVVIE